jgi:hypothetical protein
MIDITKLLKAPKDIDTMVTRKNGSQDYIVNGVAVNKKSGKAYNITVHMDTKDMTDKSKVKVACTCEDFKFRWAYVLWKQDALLNPKTFQLTPPDKTNPDQTMSACKHIHAFMANEMDHKLRTFSGRKNTI